MRITIKRSGGVAGIQMPPKVLETDDNEIKTLVHEVLLLTSDNTIADGMVYDITIEEGDETKSVCLHGESEKLFALVNKVM